MFLLNLFSGVFIRQSLCGGMAFYSQDVVNVVAGGRFGGLARRRRGLDLAVGDTLGR